MEHPQRTPNDSSPTLAADASSPATSEPQKRGASFWLVFLALCVSTFLSALDLTAISTALPTMVNDLDGMDKFVWVGSAYTLASTAFLPLSGGLAQIWGRRSVMLGSLILFLVGSAISGAARTMNMLIGGRTVQGIGGGGILSLTEIIVADLVPLRDRGTFMGIIGSVWAIASAVGPPLGGVFSEKVTWRWLFYLNLPLSGVAIILVSLFLNLRTPRETVREKFARMDWLGNLIIIASSTSTILALTWGGVHYAWSSYQILVPLILGFAGMAFFLFYEARYVKEPTVPFHLLSNRTSLSGYLGTFIHSIVATALIYYLPIYFQASKESSPVQSGVSLFGSAFTIAPFAIIAGATIAIFNRYRPQNALGWVFMMIGVGLLSTLEVDSAKGKWIGYQIIAGVGIGFLYTATTFPVLAPLPIKDNAHALALFTFVRSFSQTWGVTIGSTVLQNELSRKLPPSFIELFPAGNEIAYAIIPQIPHLPEPLRSQVHVAFAESLSLLWKVMIGVAGAGLLSVAMMKEVPMATETDAAWGMEGKEKVQDVEKVLPSPGTRTPSEAA